MFDTDVLSNVLFVPLNLGFESFKVLYGVETCHAIHLLLRCFDFRGRALLAQVRLMSEKGLRIAREVINGQLGNILLVVVISVGSAEAQEGLN